MLTFLGSSERYCDGHSRRQFLKVGALAMGGLTLPNLLRAEAQSATPVNRKSIINIYLGGGPTHMDTFDMKPNAPVEFRGELNPIPTNVPGIQICELMPRLAQNMDKSVIIRSTTFSDEHDPNQSESGWSERNLQSIGGRPSVGAVVSKLHGSVNGSAPTFVDLNGHSRHGFLGPVYAAYRPDGPGRENLTLNRNLAQGRLYNRTQLLGELDRLRRDVDTNRMMGAMDAFTERAVTMVTSGRMAEALDFRREDPRSLERYGLTQGDSRGNERFLLARRLVESGVRCVSLSYGGWDTHEGNFRTMREQLPRLDQGLSALIEDLDARGMLNDTLIMMSGEFGRTPRVNNGAGRDHWSRVGFFYLAGGGLRTGQVIGSSNRLGEVPQDRPVSLLEIFATVYRHLGIDTQGAQLIDPNGRPQYLVADGRPLRELV